MKNQYQRNATFKHIFPMVSNANSRRELWAKNRRTMERKRDPNSGNKALSIKDRAFKVFEKGLKVLGLFELGVSNALDIQVHDIDVTFSNLPKACDGYRILHITDVHIDGCEGLSQKLASIVSECTADVCVMTGDYRFAMHGCNDVVMDLMELVVNNIQCPDGILAVLGNHDSQDMVSSFEDMGVRVLINETKIVKARGEQLIFTGTDDVHIFFTENAPMALRSAPEGFKIALIHSPEMAKEAADNGFDLYLCGHTHGGQICMPGGKPILTHLNQHKDLSDGLWKYKKMVGYTSPGAGTSVMPVRFFKRPEITRFTLRYQSA